MSKENPTEESTPTQVGHTPGPWSCEYVAAHATSGACIQDSRGVCVVCFGHGYDEYGFIANDADRFLIAAAPDLLQACKIALPLLENYVQGAEEEHQRLRDAIYKAQGGL